MKVRSDILISRKAVLLGGVMLVAMFPATSALAQNANGSDWYSNGSIAVSYTHLTLPTIYSV